MTRVRSRGRLVALALAGCLIGAGCTSDPSELPDARDRNPADPSSSTEADASPEAVRLAVLPGVAQPGGRPSTSVAGTLLVASVKPVAAGEEVLLQRRQGARWRTVDRERQDAAGVASFAAPRADGPVRAVALDPAGRRSVASEVHAPLRWETVFREEFDGRSLPEAWSHRQLGLYNPEGSRQCSTSDRSTVAISGGTLRLAVSRDPARRDEDCRTREYGTHDYYLNGHVSTEGRYAFTYGVAAARIKFQRGRGQHGAFWLQRTVAEQVPGAPGVSGAEIDVAEFFGEGYPDGGLASFVYYLDSAEEYRKVGGVQVRAGRTLPPGDTWWDRFHVFSVEWTPDEYVFRVDGRETFRTAEGVSGVDQFLVLSLLSSDWELGRLDPTALPSSMEVDWVRVWQRDGRGAG